MSSDDAHTADGAQMWGVYFLKNDYYRDLLFCQHRSVVNRARADAGIINAGDLPIDTGLSVTALQALGSEQDGNRGIYVPYMDGTIESTGEPYLAGAAWAPQSSATCYADRRAAYTSGSGVQWPGSSLPVFVPEQPVLPIGVIDLDGIVNP